MGIKEYCCTLIVQGCAYTKPISYQGVLLYSRDVPILNLTVINLSQQYTHNN